MQKTANSEAPIFPFEVSERLRKAAATPIPPGDPMARVRAIAAATEWARAHFPDLFRPEVHE